MLHDMFGCKFYLIIMLQNQDLEQCSGSEGAAPHSVVKQTSPIKSIKPLNCKESAVSSGNFCRAYVDFCRKLFDSCMQVIWNAVIYDSVADQISIWRNEKLWSNSNAVVELTEGLSVEEVSCMFLKFGYWFSLYFFFFFVLFFIQMS